MAETDQHNLKSFLFLRACFDVSIFLLCLHVLSVGVVVVAYIVVVDIVVVCFAQSRKHAIGMNSVP